LLVYNFLNQAGYGLNKPNDKSKEFYTSYLRELASYEMLTAYRFGILRSHTKVGPRDILFNVMKELIRITLY